MNAREAEAAVRPVAGSAALGYACAPTVKGPPIPSTSEPNATRENAARYFLVLGAATADLWSDLPAELQHTLFERAVLLGHQGERDESLREQLAKFLHHHHARSQAR